MGKFKTSRLIASQSWALLKQDKEMVLFPILSAVTSLVVFALLFSIFNLSISFENSVFVTADGTGLRASSYLFVIAYYITSFFLINFFQAGLFVVAYARFNGQNLSFSDGIRISFSKIVKIFIWSLISATVGMILDFISQTSEIVGNIIAAVFGTAWEILTYFSLPSLIIGNTSVTGAFKESAHLIKKVWGETFIVEAGAGLFFIGLLLASFISAGVIVWMIPQLIFVCAVLLAVAVVFIVIVSSTLNSIFKLVIYEYARTGVVPNGFSPELLTSAIKSNPIEHIATTSNPQM